MAETDAKDRRRDSPCNPAISRLWPPDQHGVEPPQYAPRSTTLRPGFSAGLKVGPEGGRTIPTRPIFERKGQNNALLPLGEPMERRHLSPGDWPRAWTQRGRPERTGKRDKPEENVLRQGEGQQGQGMGIAEAVRAWIGPVGAKTDFSAPRSLSENGSREGFYARLRDELPNAEVFCGSP